MTRANAIEILIDEMSGRKPLYYTSDEVKREAFIMAIRALTTEEEPKYFPPCINCNEKQDKIIRAYNKVIGLGQESKEELLNAIVDGVEKYERIMKDKNGNNQYGLFTTELSDVLNKCLLEPSD